MTGHEEGATAQTPPMAEHLESVANAFAAFDHEVFEGPGPLGRKERELIALAVALTTQCEVCLRGHASKAVAYGATAEELAQVTYITAALRAGGGVVHGMKAMAHVRGQFAEG